MIDTTTAIVDFAQKWRHWGGGSDADIFVEFGLTPAQYFRRLQQILEKKWFMHSLAITPAVSAQLQLICQVRLASHSARNTMAHANILPRTR
ncbi:MULTISPECIES: DUF3263 domain-containing protein [Rhodococcus]|uniref:DUF3263 domain-containing protein n=1 Tax=Rhodococcus pseudokoreensis TaxID=2811421 RepID=A0A974VYR6_9NOCA|nr:MULTISPECIES: DUF3263 domain-containing protein [Rhodococcus]MCF8786225.1 DUF3263 domain-containing protein [Rhodococcus ruber]QSE88004.1 DUF3263 domain-containing protein [Rhodococcus pseudokoreensis]